MLGKGLFSERPLAVVGSRTVAMEEPCTEGEKIGWILTPRINGDLWPGIRVESVGKKKINKRHQSSC